jgi:hypothetical protein
MRTRLLVRLLPVLLALSAAGAVHAAQLIPFARDPFTDVPKTHPDYTAIEYLRKNNVIRGYLDGTFKPSQKITRAEFVALVTNPFFLQGQRESDCLSRHYGPNAGLAFFPDVDAQSESAEDICVAAVHDIVHGYPDGTFRPRSLITFAEAAKISAAVLSVSVRRDQENETRWYTPYVRRLAELHAIPVSIRSVTQPLTRAEMAEIVYRLKADVTNQATAHEQDLLR